MTTDPNTLMDRAACLRCLPKGTKLDVLIYLLDQWAQKKSSPVGLFSYTPDTASISWHETVAGSLTATSLADFYTKYTAANVDTVNLNSNGITSISNLSELTNLTYLQVYGNNLTSLDISGQTSLILLDSQSNSIISLNVTGCTALQTLYCNSNSIVALNLTGCTSLLDVDCNTNVLPVSVVNSILVHLDSGGLNGGNVDLEYQTPAAPPSGIAAILARSHLVSRGWTVTTD
jgi:Leucine-rich repeat (LRR) protein